MKRFSYAILLMLLSSTAHARGYSFSIGGHHIHIEAGRHCRSLSCVSWSDGGSRRKYRDDNAAMTPAAVAPPPPAAAAPAAPETAAPPSAPARVAPPPMPAPPPLPAQIVQPAPVPVPVKPAPVVRAQAATPSMIGLAAANAQPAPVAKVETVIGKPKEKATVEATVADKPVETPDWAKDWPPPTRDTPVPAEKTKEETPARVVAHEDDSPVGDWQTEGRKGLVRIEKCGAALCGYLLNDATNATGETVLSNMKLKNGTQWSGDIYSRASGNTYYARMTFRQPNTLRVEACAVGRFFCSGNDWTRVIKSDELISARDLPAQKS